MWEATGAGRPANDARNTILFAGERLFASSVSLMFLASSFAHLSNPYYFLSTIYSYDLLGVRWGEGIALVLPYAQLVVAACLITKRWNVEAYFVAAVVFTAFLVAQTAVLKRGDQTPCGCFGPGDSSAIGFRSLFLAGTGAIFALAGWLCATIQERLASRTRSDPALAPVARLG